MLDNYILRNAVSFMVSLALHLSALYGFYTTAKFDDTLLSDKDESDKMMVIHLNQISTNIDSQNSMQAVQNQSSQNIPQEEPVPVVEKPKEEIKEEPKKEQIKPKPKKKPKPKPKTEKKSPIVTEEEPKEVSKDESSEEEDRTGEQESTPKPTGAPSSRMTANNEAVRVGGVSRAGQSSAQGSGSARNILGVIYGEILKHKTYPKRAVNSGMQGVVKLEFLLKGKCDFEVFKVIKSSGHDFLDRHAMGIIRKACKSFPDEVIGMDIKVPIKFSLKDLKN